MMFSFQANKRRHLAIIMFRNAYIYKSCDEDIYFTQQILSNKIVVMHKHTENENKSENASP